MSLLHIPFFKRTYYHTLALTISVIFTASLIPIKSIAADSDTIPPVIRILVDAGIKVTDIGEGYYSYPHGSKIKVIDSQGKVKCEVTAIEGRFCEGRLKIARDTETVTRYREHYGQVRDGYDTPFTHSGLIKTKEQQLQLSNYDIVDTDFNSILKFPIYSLTGRFRAGKCPYTDVNNKVGFIDLDGNMICEPRYGNVWNINAANIPYWVIGDSKYNGNKGLLDLNLNEVLPISHHFKNMVAFLEADGQIRGYLFTKYRSSDKGV